MKIVLKKELRGKILDIGGGGEGVIGQLYGEQVVAIDNRQEELDEAPDDFEKILMDATKLTFSDCAFDHVTSFYALMFMRESEQQNAVSEASRVLRTNGELHIWDCTIESAYPEPFCIDLEICLPQRTIKTTYGVGKLDSQSRESMKETCTKAGLSFISESMNENSFYLCFRKE